MHSVLKSLFCFICAVFVALSLFSYNPLDPSFNKATSAEAVNLLGSMGAYIADPILQLFGLSGFLLIIFFLAWSFVLYRYKQISWWFLRVVFALIAVNALSIALNPLNLVSKYFELTGGVLGKLWYKFLVSFYSKDIVLSASVTVFIVSFYVALALPKEIWISLIECISKAIKYVFNKLWGLIKILFKAKVSSEDLLEEETPLKKFTVKTPPVISSSKNKVEKITPKFQDESVAATLPAKSTNIKVPVDINGFVLPSTDLLKDFPVNNDWLNQNNALIQKHREELLQVLTDFGVMGDIVSASSGPVVTLYELEPAAGTKSSRVIGLADDISRSMRAVSARIAVIPGRNAIGIELPNKQRETVYLKELLESAEYREANYDLPIILGKDISGNVMVVDLARMPHLLVAGTTGSGKSVAINTMIMSLVYALTPEQCKFIMIDPKMLELSIYDGIPHLLTNVVTEPGKAVVALKWVVKEMENRYRLMSTLSVRNVNNYNERMKEAIAKGEVINRMVQTGFDPETGKPQIEQVPIDMKLLPYIVVIVDEMADLMLVAGKDIETSIQRLAQMARAAGIHIIMATQRPSVDVITGVIKANFPTRVSFQVTSKIDSRTILGEQGAEQLLGKGDMLYMAGGSKITRIHGPFLADNEVEKVVSYLKSQGSPVYMNDIITDDGSSSMSGASGGDGDGDELYQEAIKIVQLEGKVSTSFIQRCLRIGYNRAANIVEQMEKEGLISKPNHLGKRDILI